MVGAAAPFSPPKRVLRNAARGAAVALAAVAIAGLFRWAFLSSPGALFSAMLKSLDPAGPSAGESDAP